VSGRRRTRMASDARRGQGRRADRNRGWRRRPACRRPSAPGCRTLWRPDVGSRRRYKGRPLMYRAESTPPPGCACGRPRSCRGIPARTERQWPARRSRSAASRSVGRWSPTTPQSCRRLPAGRRDTASGAGNTADSSPLWSTVAAGSRRGFVRPRDRHRGAPESLGTREPNRRLDGGRPLMAGPRSLAARPASTLTLATLAPCGARSLTAQFGGRRDRWVTARGSA
jgi:hypothetical protein